MRRRLPVISNCDDCGACCTGQAALPIHLVGDGFCLGPVSPLPLELIAELEATTERFMRDGFPPDGSPCIWYDPEKRQCKHYAHRPKLCRDEVKVGDKSCRRWRKTCGVGVTRYVLKNGRRVAT